MKTKHFALAIFALVFTVSASATQIPQLRVVALDDSKALFSAITDNSKSSEISIQDEYGNVVYYKESKASVGISSVFNMSELADGVYTFKVKTGTASAMQEVALENGKMEVQETKTQMEPYFALDGNKLKISYLNFDGEDVMLYVYDGNKTVYESGLGNSFVVQKGLTLANPDSESFDVVLTANNQVYNYSVAK